MTRAATTIFVFGVYVLVLGAMLIFLPNLVIGPFGFPEAREPWIRVLGVVTLTLGGYYVAAARKNVTPFFSWTVVGRFTILLAFVALVLAGLAPPALIAFGLFDAVGAAWTWAALRRPN